MYNQDNKKAPHEAKNRVGRGDEGVILAYILVNDIPS